MGKDKRTGSFDALKALKNRAPTPAQARPQIPAKAGKPVAKAEAPMDANPDDAGPDDASLFRAQVGKVQALRAAERADLGRPRPAPVPRPRSTEIEPEAPRPAPRIDPNDPATVFRAALGDIAPIKDFNRADLSNQRQQANPQVRAFEQIEPQPPRFAANTTLEPAELFRLATSGAQPIKDKNRVELAATIPAPLPRKREEDERQVLREALETPLSFEDRLDMGDEAAYLRTGLPRRILTDLRRGRWVVQGELDLHGLTRDEARASLAQFIAAALAQGLRCLRIIHGKGHGSPGRIPVLKHLSRGWLAQREDILAFCQAKPHDGGDGALLVLLQAGTATRS